MINNIKTLSSLNEGSSGRVAELKINGSMRRRLQDIGLIEGTEVLCLQKSPSGDPVAYLIRGAVPATFLNFSAFHLRRQVPCFYSSFPSSSFESCDKAIC